MKPILIRKIWPYTTSPITGMTGYTVVVIYLLACIQGFLCFIINHIGFIQERNRSQFPLLQLDLRNLQFLLVLFQLGFAPTQNGIVDKINNPEAYGKNKYILKPGWHEIIQLDNPIVAVVFQYLTFCYQFPLIKSMVSLSHNSFPP